MKNLLLLMALPLMMALPVARGVPVVVAQDADELTDYYFESTLVRETYLELGNGSTLSQSLKTKLRSALLQKTCKAGLIRVTLNTKVATDWRAQLRLHSPISEDIREKVHPALESAMGEVACDSNIAISSSR